ncbi:tripartite tricarboxylate transporter substrate-binding protein [Cupriavidus gilardii]|uniref:Tripartite tricarboxylate transporter substrate-binding protein n=1 Tax=Cupriavidus gilardii TaxID=82541 RepID=A0ABY4VPJ9_9BURK|nr:tripartite tricarboxylate transporter substrate-binding protein [Cupriavidus gilardii]USE77954.1 tripartite tricarboxylate transporter substrate-binding protein [Cupriavidus gilardii]
MKLAIVAALLLGSVLGTAAMPAAAQTPNPGNWPGKPITLIMPFPAGGPSDALARAVAAKMAPRLGTSIVVENVGGAGGSIGMQKLARAPADGYTIGFGTIGTHAANMILYRKPLYDARKDFEPLGLVGSAPVLLLLLVRRDLPVDDFKQFADHLRAHQANMSYGSAGVGSIAHLACLMLLGDLKAEVMHVPYKGVAPAMAGLMGGETDFTCDQTTTSLAQVAGGRVRAVAVLTREPLAALPKLATAQASGRTRIDFRSWNALFAPRGTPPAVVARLNQAINDALADPALIRQMREVGVEFPARADNTPANLARLVDSETARLRPILEANKVQLD